MASRGIMNYVVQVHGTILLNRMRSTLRKYWCGRHNDGAWQMAQLLLKWRVDKKQKQRRFLANVAVAANFGRK